ncbi:MAG: sigma-70 family RNA polymerase sigma factor [Prevotellaceae bacterium]|nr:sigma-70 family RNA polymerase sigma factor [Prevotella sp.]MDD6818490.1 sigma-70 family RNA polymerase sigma factor [Prevotellaceae bacterium]MCI6558217.1 sigma-70 family RNA polymerase sigma factor [Prevotella sp.]MCI7044987.1 sigma-70 family RNA polymerase sigma factor [Prevotella sp.]MDD6843256.1 sigma-70 family RNA polymerase sigma factor [Prevotellaceae bacterium]
MKNYEAMTDEALALLYASGDNRAFDVLLERIQGKLFKYILYLVNDEEKAEDIFQDTIVKIIVKIQDGYYTNTGKFYWWVTRMAHNLIMDWFRSNDNNIVLESEDTRSFYRLADDSHFEFNREQELVNEQVLEDVRRLMDYLPFNQREMVVMRYYQNMPFREIAETLGISINTALGRFRYAILNMRRMIKDHDLCLELCER